MVSIVVSCQVGSFYIVRNSYGSQVYGNIER
jgi:hypothetical protein